MDDLIARDAIPRQRPEGAAGLVLQRLPLGRDVSLRALYLRGTGGGAAAAARCRAEGSTLVLPQGAALSFDTYVGAFFERAWRGPTTLRALSLDLRASGSLALRVLRRSAEGEEVALHEEVLAGFDGLLSIPLPSPITPAAGGRLFAEVTALRGGCAIEALEWRTPDTPLAAPVGLVPVFCTFGREEQLGAVLAALAAEPGVPATRIGSVGPAGGRFRVEAPGAVIDAPVAELVAVYESAIPRRMDGTAADVGTSLQSEVQHGQE